MRRILSSGGRKKKASKLINIILLVLFGMNLAGR